MDRAATWRLFIALELPPALREHLERRQAALRRILSRRAVHWVPPEAMHLTLRFLGQVAAGRRQRLEEALLASASAHRPLDLRPGGLGTFGGPRRPRVVWLGLEGDVGGLGRLAADLDGRLGRAGWPAAEHPFRPHLTLGRVRASLAAGERRALDAVMGQEAAAPRGAAVVLTDLALFRSHLLPDGARHEVLCRARLGGAPA